MSNHTGSGHEPDREDAGPGPDHDGDPDVERGVTEGVEHLQVAAREMIAAARTFLDVVEEVVGDRAAVASLADALGSVGQVVSRAAWRAPGEDDPDRREPPDGPRVQHIDVS